MHISHVEKLVEDLYESLTVKVIDDLKTLGRDYMQSSDDSGLENVWQEFVFQLQEGESIFWQAYVETALAFCLAEVNKLSYTEQRLLWLFTEPGGEYTFDIDYDRENHIEPNEDEEPISPSYDIADVAQQIYERVVAVAESEESSLDDEDSEDDEVDMEISDTEQIPFDGTLELFYNEPQNSKEGSI